MSKFRNVQIGSKIIEYKWRFGVFLNVFSTVLNLIRIGLLITIFYYFLTYLKVAIFTIEQFHNLRNVTMILCFTDENNTAVATDYKRQNVIFGCTFVVLFELDLVPMKRRLEQHQIVIYI